LIGQPKQNSQQTMNSAEKDTTAEIIDLDLSSVTDHDAPGPQASESSGTRRVSLATAAGRPILVVAALAMAAFAGGWFYKDVLWRYVPNDQMSALATRADALAADNGALKDQVMAFERLAAQLKADVDALETAQASAAAASKAASEAVAGLSTRVDGLAASAQESQDKLSGLAAEVRQLPLAATSGAAAVGPDAGVVARLEAIEKDVASLKGQKNEGAVSTALLSQNLADLKAKIAAGSPFADELQRLTLLVPAAPGLEELAPYARAGLPDARGLAQELAALASSLPAQGELQAVAPKDDSWSGWALEKFSDLIAIRVAGTADWKKEAQAAAALAESGDLQQAVEHLKAMEGARPQGVDQWIEKAEARLAVEAELKSVEEAVLRAIAAKG
jgi:hypothetical protein